jgi:hypothetical protein
MLIARNFEEQTDQAAYIFLRFLWVELPAEILPQLEGRFA